MPRKVIHCVFLIPIFMLSVFSCNQSAEITPSEIRKGTDTPSQIDALTVATSTFIPTKTAVSPPIPFITITPTILLTLPDPIDRVWPDLLFGPCVSCELEPANVKVNSSGFVIVGSEKDMQRNVLILDESKSSPERTYLFVEITRHESSKQAKEYSMLRKSQRMEERFTDLQSKQINQFPEATWIIQQDRTIVMLGSTYRQLEFTVYLKTYLASKEESIHPFTDLNSAARIVVVATQAQFKKFEDVIQ